MNVADYIKLRCALNNVNYAEIKRDLISSLSSTYDMTYEKLVRDQNNNIKYSIKYTIKDHDSNKDVNELEYEDDYRFTANVSCAFFLKRNDLKNNKTKFNIQRYDCLSIYYHFSFYKDPTEIEEMVDNIWKSLSIFTNDPYLSCRK